MINPFETDERRAFRETVARFVGTEIRPFADEWDEAGDFPRELHQKAGQLGMFGFGIDEKYGGLGFDDCFMRAAMWEELGKCWATGVAAAIGTRNNATGPIQALASEEIKQGVLPDVLSGHEEACLALTEPSGGSDLADMRTRARRDGEHYCIDGSKTFITGGLTGRYFVVGARTADEGLRGISLFIVERGTPGFSMAPLQRKMGWWCSNQATLFFDDCRVPAGNLVGEENHGFRAIVSNFNQERVALVAQALGMAKVCLEESIAWAQQRRTFGKQLIEHQVIRHKIADMSARIDAVESYLNQICWLVNAGEKPVAEICKAKFFATGALEFCASEAMQILGGAGYLRGNPVERMYREVKVMAIGGGSAEIMRDLAVRQMGL